LPLGWRVYLPGGQSSDGCYHSILAGCESVSHSLSAPPWYEHTLCRSFHNVNTPIDTSTPHDAKLIAVSHQCDAKIAPAVADVPISGDKSVLLCYQLADESASHPWQNARPAASSDRSLHSQLALWCFPSQLEPNR
jgi:hypothetical protein